MDNEVNALEHILLDESAKPMQLSFSLLQDITNCFSDDRQIGRGGFAVVYKGMVRHAIVAVKKLTFNMEEKKFDKEVECLVKAKHKNVVRILGYCAETQKTIGDHEGKFVMADIRNWLLCFEYVPNGSLHKYITDASQGLEWRKRYEIIKGICEGLCYLHDKRILHLDLKPDNILMDDHMVPKITDFGLSRCLDEDQTQVTTTIIYGSIGYLAPEFFKGKFTFMSDIFSLGVTIVEILTGERGYPEDENVTESWINRLEGDTQLDQVRLCTKIGIECMRFDPKKRPSISHIVDRLDKTESIVEPVISGSSSEQQVSSERHCQERIRNTSADEIQDVAQCLQTLQNDQCQEKEDQRPVCGSHDMKQDRKDASISSYDSSAFQKLSILDIINRKSHRNFVRNGGPTIQQSKSVKIFREEELKTILNISNLVGRGAYGEVYGGLLGNKQVKVRKPIAGSLPDSEDFANEVIKRSQVTHTNILKLIGCCLEVDIPLLVYEFFSKDSLYDILHRNKKVPLNLGVRLRIAAQAADGVAYMNSEMNGKILFCGNLEASNVLLDDNFVPKISDFGLPWSVVGRDYYSPYFRPRQPAPPSRRPAPLIPRIMDYFIGRPAPSNGGYFIGRPADFGISGSASGQQPGDYFVGRPADQEFMEDNQLIQQSDVYNFGVIILELISRKKATHDETNSLVKNFLKSHVQGEKATSLFDKEIAERRNLAILYSLTEIAVECLSIDVDSRPKMTEIAERLLRLSRKYMTYGAAYSSDSISYSKYA
ncbi:hypothetical protein CFC21_004467 [Triticum aestivum]|uniref:Protein kinase domain-containing protein n=1 Tax=Triticum aestivum TaxID=4565 RepID=A0A3B5Y7S9_WHEAT|nr:hypothetical protein CFC21_004467 [Triticum aestivum]